MMDSKSEEESIKKSQQRVLTTWRRIRKRRLLKNKKAAEEMDKPAQQMESMMSQEEEELEKHGSLRALLENIIRLSFEERPYEEINHTDALDPRYVELDKPKETSKTTQIV